MKIIAFGASNSSQSINKQFATYVAHQIDEAATKVLDLNDFEVPIFSVDRERANGHPDKIKRFVQLLEEADLVVISLAEHNGSYSTAFKNLLDWGSRVYGKLLTGKMLLLSTATGARGGKSVMETALTRFPRHGAEIIGHFSLPVFQENFDPEQGIINAELRASFEELLRKVKEEL